MSTCADQQPDLHDGPKAASDPVAASSPSGAGLPPTGSSVQDSDQAAKQPRPQSPPSAAAVRPFTWCDLTGILDPPRICLRLGSLRLSAEQQRALRPGSVVRLDPEVDAPVEIMVGRQLLGYGRVVLADGKLAVQVTTRRQPVRRQSA